MSERHIANLEIEDLETTPPKITTVPLFCGKSLKFGRDEKTNDHTHPSPTISRNHLEIYSLSIDKDAEPFILARDLDSGNGTFVNGILLRLDAENGSVRVLEDQDVIELKPFWRVKVTLLAKRREPLDAACKQQINFFSHEYEVTERILGYGASTTVHLAYDTRTKRQLACKIYDLKSMREQRCHTELQAAVDTVHLSHELDHIKIAAMQRVYMNQDVIYVFEELATGGDLLSLLKHAKKLEELEVRYIMFQLVRGVKYLHEKGIAHRDIKLENVLNMVCPKVGERVAFTDFCHAGLVSAGPLRDRVGTIGWQAPEQYSPSGVHGIAVDMWAVGIMAAQLLAGNALLETLETFEQQLSHKNPNAGFSHDALFAELRSIRRRDIEPSGKDFMRRCLDFNPQTRLTAQEAWRHPWLSEPTQVRALFESRDAASEKHWRSRSVRNGWLHRLGERRESGNTLVSKDQGVFKKPSSPASKAKSPSLQSEKEVASTEVKASARSSRGSEKTRSSARSSRGFEKARSCPLELGRLLDPTKKMSVRDRVRKFGVGGRLGDMLTGRRAISLDKRLSSTPRRRERNRAKLELIDDLKRNKSLFVTRQMSSPVEATEQSVPRKRCYSLGANNDDDGQVTFSYCKRRKLVHDTADGEPIDLKTPRTPV